VFEFHGWATIRVDDRDDPDLDVLRRREEEAIGRLRTAVKAADDEFSLLDLRRTGNGLIVLLAHGLRNHRYGPVVDLFRWVAAELPFSYGLLYVHGDEDMRGGSEPGNAFRVWRLARGRFDELADPFLSPYIPTVEPPWGEAAGT
jgi:hypothetical protein